MESPVTETKAMFSSNLFGSLGAGVFVGPNLIDFSTVFDNVGAKILENLPVFVTVLLLMILYIPFVIICRKFDKKDEIKVCVLVYYSILILNKNEIAWIGRWALMNK